MADTRQHIDIGPARVTAWVDDEGQLRVDISAGDLTGGPLTLDPKFHAATVKVTVDGAGQWVDPVVTWADLHSNTDHTT